ncbi:MAG: hypothetical protein WDA18_05230 [Candidatus Ratteibacteria bacterium]
MQKDETVFSFDLGTAGIAECVRNGSTVYHLSSLLLPADFAEIRQQAQRRRAMRTRLAHRAREDWWRKCAEEFGIEVLETRQPMKGVSSVKPDPRMLREFPEKGDTTIYTSSLLRIALLQGFPLEGWQVFKAIWSAIQHRGYDANLPWANRSHRKSNDSESDKDERENRLAVVEYEKRLQDYFGEKREYCYPCYYEAYKMGIWDSTNPKDPNFP